MSEEYMNEIKEVVMEKEFIRIFLRDINDNPIICNRKDEYTTTIDKFSYEDLNMKEDKGKLDLYLKVDYIELYNGKSYKVTKRSFMPTRPVSLYITLEEGE